MLIFTNCLTDVADEGCVNVANSLIKRIKAASPETAIVSYERRSALTDIYVNSNKLLLTKDIAKTVRKAKEDVLFIPFPARSSAIALRLFVLSLIAPKKVRVLLTQVTDISFLAKALFKLCGADFFVLSKETQKKLEDIVGGRRVKRIKAGVDTSKFVPVDKSVSANLKHKYGLNPEKAVVLHVGHLNSGRNISKLLELSAKYQILLVISSLTKDERDENLRQSLRARPNIKIIDEFLPDIEEIFQLCDVYFFPVIEAGRCIDVPLSCLEAAACNKPVVTTDFGEMKEFKGKKDFWFIDSFEPENLNSLIEKALQSCDVNTRACVTEYDWSRSVKYFLGDI